MNRMANIRVTTLPNGLRVASDAMDTVETAAVGVWVNVGARHEQANVNGVSHMLEHMAFKGTERRSARAIAEEIEAVGGHLNAYTSREHTAYYARVLKDDVPLAIDLLADILQHSVMDADELERERAVIVQEIRQAHDTPDDIVFDHFQTTAFPNQSLGRPVLGSAELVESLPREALLGYMRDHYSAPQVVVAGAGRLDHDQLVALADAAFKDLPPQKTPVGEPGHYAGGDFRELRPLEQVHILLGLEGFAYEDPDYYAASVFATLFGGGMSSRLFQEVREKRGLVYSIYSYMSSYSDAGLFGVYAGTGENQVPELIPIICEEFHKVSQMVGEAEVLRARAQLKASILMSLESPSSRCEQLARQLLIFDRPIPVAEVVAKIEAVDVTAVQRAAKRLLATRPTVTALGPARNLASFDEIARQLS